MESIISSMPARERNTTFTVTVFTRVIPRLARSVWQRTIHIPINRADSCAVQATVRRWKTAMETGGIPRQCRSAKTTIWSVASASGGQASTKMVSCSAISSSATGRWRWSRQKKTRGQNPEWYLLSYQKAMSASSSEEGREPFVCGR